MKQFAERSGLIAKKVGMTRLFDENGRHIPVTVLQLDEAQVTATRTTEKDGYTAVQVGMMPQKSQRMNKAQLGQFKKNGVEPKRLLKEFRIKGDLPEVGTTLTADYFAPGQFVDIAGTSKGRGFTGAMKRWNFSGLRASHGVSVSHRSHGSTGQCQDPGKVFKGKKMAGHYGAERITQQNLKIVKVDTENNLILVKGSIPGAKGQAVFVKDAVKKAAKQG